MKQRIAILADFPWSFFEQGATGRGGGQTCTWLVQLAEELAKDSTYEIHWISLDRSRIRGGVKHQEWGGQQFHQIGVGRIQFDLALGYRLSRWLLRRELRRIQPDLVHCWGTERSYPVVCGRVKAPTILSMQGVMSNLLQQGYLPEGWIGRRMTGFEAGFLSRATLVTCESQWAIERVQEVAADAELRQVEYGVHPSFYEVAWHADEARPYAVFVGALTKAKGVDVLLDAARQVGGRGWSVKFVGDGPLRTAIETCGLPQVECLGLLPWDELQRVLAGATCLVHPTRADSSPNVVKEARVIGLPVVTTRHGGQTGYIRDGENGLIVDPLEPDGLARALSRVMEDPELARRMGASRHAADREYFRSAVMVKAFRAIYDELLEKRKRPRIAIAADFPWGYFKQGATGRGGGQSCPWLVQLAESLAKQTKYEVHWVMFDRTRWLGRSEHRKWGGQQFHRLPGGDARVDLFFGYIPARLRLWFELTRIRPDLIHVWGTERSYPVACGKLGVPSILSMQGILTEYARIGAFRGNWTMAQKTKWESGFVAAATVVTAESKWGMERVKEVCPRVDVRQVEYGVHQDFYSVQWQPDRVAPYAFYAGEFSSRKGVDLLIEAVSTIKDRGWRLKLAGSGRLRAELEGRGVAGVEWLGLLEWKAMKYELAHASCLVLPTRADTSPNVVKEARVIGLPVITSRHGGQAGYIRDGENGIIVEPLAAAGLAAALSRVMDDPQLARQLGEARHAEDREYFQPSNTARGFAAIYDELLGNMPPV